MPFLFFRKPKSKSIVFSLPHGFEDEVNAEAIFDEAFFQNQGEYSPSLAKLSFAFAISSFSSNKTRLDLSRSADNGKKFLKDAGFRKIRATEDYFLPPTSTSLGALFGKKKIRLGKKKVTLIAIGIRGGNYGAEWASNVTLGEYGPHEGFSLSKEKLYQDFIRYLCDNSIRGRIAIWVCGFSRAAGVANLFAGDIIEESSNGEFRIGKCSIHKDRLFAYCFASPATGRGKEEGFAGIFHIINPNDIVPMLPPKSFGFLHYGRTIYLPDTEDEEVYEKALSALSKLGIEIQRKDFGVMKFDILRIKDKERRFLLDTKEVLVGQGEFFQRLFAIIEERLDRKSYYEEMQEGLASLLCLVDSSLSDPYSHIKGILSNMFSKLFDEHNVLSLITKLKSRRFDLNSFLLPYFHSAVKERGIGEINEESVVNAITYLLKILLPSIEKNPGLLATLIYPDNASLLLFAHQPYLYWALLNLAQ